MIACGTEKGEQRSLGGVPGFWLSHRDRKQGRSTCRVVKSRSVLDLSVLKSWNVVQVCPA